MEQFLESMMAGGLPAELEGCRDYLSQLMGRGGLIEEAHQARKFWNSDAAMYDRMERLLEVTISRPTAA